MSRGKICLPTVSRQFLTHNCPHPNCLLKCLPNCLFPTREGFLSSFKINPAVRVIARQVRDKNCLAAIFAPRHQSVSSGPLGIFDIQKGPPPFWNPILSVLNNWTRSVLLGKRKMTPHKRFSKMIFLNAKNSESALLAEPHDAVMFSCRTLTFSAKVSCRTLEIAEPKALNLEKDNLAEPWNAGSFRVCLGERLRGNTIRGNRPERFWEGNLPLRGSPRGPLRGRVFRGFQRFLEVFRGFQRFSEVFRDFQRFFKGPLRAPLRVPFSSQSCGSCCP